jgi:hypothetical protein
MLTTALLAIPEAEPFEPERSSKGSKMGDVEGIAPSYTNDTNALSVRIAETAKLYLSSGSNEFEEL